MYFPTILILLAAAVSARIQRDAKSSCPTVWSKISKELTGIFLSDGHCNDDARAAIRAALHDCFPDGGCDGSIFLALEMSRPENQIIGPTVYMLGSMAEKYKVGVADMIQFAACTFTIFELHVPHFDSIPSDQLTCIAITQHMRSKPVPKARA
jgi:hypothetical protein